jgi:hypothetical protein
MPYALREATREEIPAIVDIGRAVFGHNYINMTLFPQSVREAPEWNDDDRTWRIGMAEEDFGKPGKHFILVTDQDNDSGTEKVIGAAAWESPESESHRESEEERKRKIEEQMKMWPASMDREAFMDIRGKLGEFTKEKIGEKESQDMWGRS